MKIITDKLKNKHWVDTNNNKWLCDIYDEKAAVNLSKSLINCRNCSDCSDCRNCSDCSDCRNCSYCSYCSNCRNCRNCSDYKKNPQRYTTPRIGSRHSTTTIYWTNTNDSQIVCGCFVGNLVEFEKKVVATYSSGHKYRVAYQKEINIMKCLIKSTTLPASLV